MSNNHDNGKQPSKRESRRDKWAMNLAKSDRLEIKGPSEEQLVEANSSSKNASLTVMGQPLYVSVSSLVLFAYWQLTLFLVPDLPRMLPSLPWASVSLLPMSPSPSASPTAMSACPGLLLAATPCSLQCLRAVSSSGLVLLPRQARIITHYLRAPGPNYKMVSCEPVPHEERLEREFTDALAINAQATSFNLLELAGLALAHMEAYGDMISLTRIMINFMAQGEWYQRNRCYVQDYVTRRFTSTYPMAMHHDRKGFGHQTGDPLIDGLLGAINGLRFPDLPFPSYPHHYY
ncbi:hypothetical protein V3481_011678 [Fusarium oxysporum f. sp. vasinfectum]|uniref:Uncharacterized protein n=1 Tax=Fusarium oxysporum f. sp. vasinfectum 25433 TaxID=1089449 RepID=X0LR58_FUSOX|nr:hypothetical protein FOTG_09342 [Fusarium oxysporum f. sp. vasinfectum 25433]